MESALVKLSLVVALMVAQYNLTLSLRSQDIPWVPSPQAQEEKWNPTLFRILSFGHLPVMVDLLWIRAHQDPSYFHVAPGSHPPAYYDFELITDLDPLFSDAYTTGASVVAVVRNDGPGARDLLLKGDKFRMEELPKQDEAYRSRYWSRHWDIPLLLAYVYLFELGDLPTAAQYFVETSKIPGAPTYLPYLAKRLSAPGGHFEVGFKLLERNIENAKEPRIRDEWIRKRNSLVVVKFLTDRREEFARFLERRKQAATDAEFEAYRREYGVPPVDPWGGRLGIDDKGRITTTTPYSPVLGIE